MADPASPYGQPSAGSARWTLALGDLLADWVLAAVPPDGAEWFTAARAAIRAGDDQRLGAALGLAPRRLGKVDLVLAPADLAAIETLRPGFDPHGLSSDQAARIALLLATHHGDDWAFAEQLDHLCRTAEINELIALYRGLPLYPGAALLVDRAREGVRSGMRPVFEAVAQRSPFPREMFDEDGWNQMVMKALFVGSELAPIQGLDARANPDLADRLVDYAHERWAAGRSVSPELWRCVAPFADRFPGSDIARLSAL